MSASTDVPGGAYAMRAWQLDAWELRRHPWPASEVRLVRSSCYENGEVFDGYLVPSSNAASAYVLGWMNGRLSAIAGSELADIWEPVG